MSDLMVVQGVVLLLALGTLVGTLAPRALAALPLEQAHLRRGATRLSLACALVAGLLVLARATAWLSSGASSTLWRFGAPDYPGIPDFSLQLYRSPLSSFFLMLVGSFAAAIALYSFGWLDERNPRRHVIAGAFNLFTLTTLFTLVVNHLFWLLVSLELLSLSVALLILARESSGEPGATSGTVTALRTYLLVSHISLALLIAGAVPLCIPYGMDFGVLARMTAQATAGPAPTLSFLLIFLALGARAGLVPFHSWPAIVHPHLPTNTHAMISAIMLKVAIFWMIRFFFELLGPISWWWGLLVLLIAALTALVAVFYALLSNNLKVALAYHSIENIGIIVAGIGLALHFASRSGGSRNALVGLALVAALFHVANHALFKTLLFLGTGSIEQLTGSVELDRLGGLLNRFPWTGGTFLLGAVAIAGFPPLNGFISEWLLLQTVFVTQITQQPISIIGLVVLLTALILLGLSFALTALAFVKIGGEALLGLPREPERARGYPTHDAPWTMRVVLLGLAGACLLVGVLPLVMLHPLSAAVAGMGFDVAPLLQLSPARLAITLPMETAGAIPPYRSPLSLLPIWALLTVPLLLLALRALFRLAAPTTRGPVWAGGDDFDPRTMQYSGAAFSSLVWDAFSRPVDGEPAQRALPEHFPLAQGRVVRDPVNHATNLAIQWLLAGSHWFGTRLQDGDVRRYLVYILLVVFAVLSLLIVSR